MTSYTTSSSVQTHVLGKDSQATPSFVSLLELKIEKPAPPKNPITIAIIGAGERGKGYAYYAYAHPDWLKVVSVAEPNEFRRNAMKERYKIPDENVFTDWVELANRPKLCDAIVIATLEHMHAEPTVLFSNLGYHILLEKPMANTIEDCRRITEAAIRNQLIKRIIEKGLLGKIINIQHMEPVGFWHFAHSVRCQPSRIIYSKDRRFNSD
ncbi:hypothetical protein G9A89_007017 [Geosiphon pyriformis]|nr:hypothetical protein G9A89_007017 [Geosiphon pyriformis]